MITLTIERGTGDYPYLHVKLGRKRVAIVVNPEPGRFEIYPGRADEDSDSGPVHVCQTEAAALAWIRSQL